MSGKILGLAGVAALAVLYFAAHPIGFSPDQACVGNARILNIALQSYVQDNDEQLPLMQTPRAFQSALNPYVSQPTRFVCPDTGHLYQPHSAIGGRGMASFMRTDDITTFQDSVPHSDGGKMISYLDGHITFAGIVQGQPDQLCVDNVRQLALATMMYSQDYDEVLPIYSDESQFQAATLPYVKNPSTYLCPVTHQAYAPNVALSGKMIVQIKNASTAEVIQDSVPHPDGSRSVGYLDGHVTLNGVTMPAPSDLGNMQQFGLAYLQYLQDYGGALPPLSPYYKFKRSMAPYVQSRGATFTQPSSGMDYVLNTALNGDNISQISNASSTPLISDPAINPDGTDNTVYADGSVQTQDYQVASEITADPRSGNPALVWTRANGLVTIDDLSPQGGVTHVFTYQHPVNAPIQDERRAARDLSGAIEVYISANNDVLPPLDNYADFEAAVRPYMFSSADLVEPGSGAPYQLDAAVSGVSLSTIADPSTVWTFQGSEADGSTLTDYVDGHQTVTVANPTFNPSAPALAPFYPPALTAVAGIAGDKRQLVWGQSEVWTTGVGGAVQHKSYLGPYEGWSLTSIANVGDGPSTSLWTNDTDGSLALWHMNESGGYVSDTRLTPGSGDTPVGMVIAPTGDVEALLSAGHASAVLWTVSPSGQVTAEHHYGGPVGSNIAGLAVSPKGQMRLLWDGGDGSATIYALAPSFGIVKQITFAIASGWSTNQIAVDSEGKNLVLWKMGATALLERISPNGTVLYTHTYAPQP